jgi:broad specificity phosphatase PhoE
MRALSTRIWSRALLALLGAVSFVAATAVGPPTASSTGASLSSSSQDNQASIEALQSGGYVIFFRHAATDLSLRDEEPINVADCTTQRNLTEEGRAQARRIGEGFRARGIPVGEVLSSEFCRALETARLAFGRAEARPELFNSWNMDPERREQATGWLRRLLTTVPEPGTNTVIVSHWGNLVDATYIPLDMEAEAAIFRPDGAGTANLRGRVLAAEWTGPAGP